MERKIILTTTQIALICAISFIFNFQLEAQKNVNVVTVNWDKTTAISKTTATLQLVENPMVRKNSPIHGSTFKALKELGADYVRYVPWFPYPKMAVAELKRPVKDKTFWDFTYLDSTMHVFMKATEGHSVVINFSTTPAWMWKTDSGVTYPEDPYQTCWNYNQGTQLKDTTMEEVSDYFTRLFSWYTKGGFTDEFGKFHKSGLSYKIPYWEVLNEPDLEHNISPQLYTKMYDAIVLKLKKISPETKFVGLSLAHVTEPEYFEYFLNPKNHKSGISLEGISYHHYSKPSVEGQQLESYQYTFFENANAFLDKVRYIENIRKRLAPKTFTMINEIGVILRSSEVSGPIEENYWNLAGAMYAYIYLELAKIGIDVAGESQLVGYPTQFPDVSMMNWENGKPNARFWVLKLLRDNFGPGNYIVSTDLNTPEVGAQGFKTRDGRKILLINKRNAEINIQLPADAKDALVSFVDINTNENPPSQNQLSGSIIKLKPFSVAVIKFKN